MGILQTLNTSRPGRSTASHIDHLELLPLLDLLPRQNLPLVLQKSSLGNNTAPIISINFDSSESTSHVNSQRDSRRQPRIWCFRRLGLTSPPYPWLGLLLFRRKRKHGGT